MKSKIIFFFICFITWSLLCWVPDLEHIIVGIIVSIIISMITGDIFINRPHVLTHIPRYYYLFFVYFPVFLWECFKANIDVAYRVLHPALPIKPGIVKIKTKLKTDIALTFLANSITLTPGTLCVDIDRDNSVLYIHWINVKDKDTDKATKIISERFEKILTKIFE